MGKRAAADGAGRSRSNQQHGRGGSPRRRAGRAGGGVGGVVANPEALERRVLLSSSPATTTVNWNGYTTQAIAGQYLLQTKNVAAFEKLATKLNFTDLTSLGSNGQYWQFSSSLPIAKVIHLASLYPAVTGTVEPNFVQSLDSTVPNDTYFGDQYGLRNTGQDSVFDYNGDKTIEDFEQNHYGTEGDDIDATDAWDITTGSSAVVVADLDTGVDLAQPDLAPNIYTVPNYPTGQAGFADDIHGWNFVSNNNDVTDLDGHGTNTAGIIGAEGENAAGVAGVNWHVSLLPVKISDDGAIAESTVIQGINYCTLLKSQGVNVVAMNMSFGSTTFPLDTLEQNALAAAGQVGILAITSAGNDANTASPTTGNNLDGNLFRTPAKFSSANQATRTSNVITVAAVDNQGNLALFSNYGASTVELAAPGVNILSTEPTYAVSNSEITYVDPSDPTGVPYGYMSGTSQAAPFVTGIIALEAAANPAATAAELKSALLNGVKPDAALAAVNGGQPLVATSGVADAYTSIQNILNYSTGTDTVHQGNWTGVYGTDGQYIVGASTAFPSFVTGTLSGGSPVVLQSTSRSVAALQKPTAPTQHLAAYQASAGSESVELNFTDGAVHQVELYVADLDRKHRSESIALTSVGTGQLLSTQAVSNFSGGEYLIYDLRGDVKFTFTNTGGPSAVFSGIFFDPPTTSPATLVSTDTSTTGANWRGSYGSAGDFIVGDDNDYALPADVSSFGTAAPVTVLHPTTKATVALNKNADIYHNIEAYWSAPTSFDLNVAFNDTVLHQVTLYAADYDHKKRSERIEVLNAAGSLLASQDVSNFTKGEFVTFDVTGSVTFRVVNLAGLNAVVSGVFFDQTPGENASFQGIDSGTQGNWQQTGYGSQYAFVVGDTFPTLDTEPFTNPIITNATNLSERLLQPLSTDPRALERAENGMTRIEAYLYTTTTMSFEVNFEDNLQHQLALYFADYERFKRNENLTITDATTGQVLIKQKVFSFQNGKYFLYNVNGPVIVSISSAAANYPNAVISGIFAG